MVSNRSRERGGKSATVAATRGDDRCRSMSERPESMNGKQVKRLIAIVALAFMPLAASALDLTGLPPAFAEKVTAARQACADVGNGEFALEWGAVTRTDLDGDLSPDWVLDESAYACSTRRAGMTSWKSKPPANLPFKVGES